MTKDFKSSQRADTPMNDVVTWVLAGVALGLFAGLMVYVFSSNEKSVVAHTVSAEQDVQQASTADTVTTTTTSDATTEQASSSEQDEKPINAGLADNKPQNDKISNQEKSMAELDKIMAEKFGKDSVEDDRPIFDYHVILPSLDVEVPVARPKEYSSEKKSEKRKPKKAVEKKIAKSGKYMMQVGSYKRESDAGGMKRRVGALTGMSPFVQKASVRGQTWYRVRLGPLTDSNQINKIRRQLSSNGIQPFLQSVQ